MTTGAPSLKRRAAETAMQFVTSGMVIGLGGGSTALQAIICLSERLKTGKLHDVVGIPCSEKVARDARRLNVPLTTFDEHSRLDLTIDGADEVDPSLRLIKGGGGALLREKIVAQASDREIIIVDESKLSPVLGVQWAVPVEVVPFGWRLQQAFLEELGASVRIRTKEEGGYFVTDQGNLVLDANFGPIQDASALALALKARTGIVEHGLFIGLATDLVVAGEDGVTHRRASRKDP